MHPLERHIAATIDRLSLLRRSAPVIVALSGGADSVALLSVLTALGYDCIAAHCNFHLRGAESNRDMLHAQAVAARLGVDIYVRNFNVEERMKATGESVEMACRSLRYGWFEQLLDRDYSQAVAVAHHREDNIETFFLNLLRSTGIDGLTGMDYRRDYVVRPMLDVSRSDIEKYLSDKGLEYVVDSSNALNEFKRNRLRNIVLPLLEKEFPGASNAVIATISHLAQARNVVDDAVMSASHRIRTADDTYDIAALAEESSDPVRASFVLYQMLKNEGLNATQVENILSAVRAGRTGLRFDIDADRFAELDRGILSFHSRRHEDRRDLVFPVSLKRDILHPVNIQITPHDVSEFRPLRNPDVMYLDLKALERSPIVELRHPRTADRMKPFGMTSDKLVSDILSDAKLTSARKRDIWLLTVDDKIVWIVGLRASAHFTVTPDTRRYLELRYIP